MCCFASQEISQLLIPTVKLISHKHTQVSIVGSLLGNLHRMTRTVSPSNEKQIRSNKHTRVSMEDVFSTSSSENNPDDEEFKPLPAAFVN